MALLHQANSHRDSLHGIVLPSLSLMSDFRQVGSEAAISIAIDAWRNIPRVDFSRIGPQPGERFPDVALPDQTGGIVDLHERRAGRRALILFERSLGW